MSWHRLIKKSDIAFKKTVHKRLAFLIVLLLVGACSNPPVNQKEPVESFIRHLDKRIPVLMDSYNIPGISIALVQDGKMVWSNAYGYADIEQNQKMSLDAICRTESISKSVSAWGVMKLVERGLINLDDPVQQYLHDFSLPQTAYNPKEITIRRLLSNSAGMPLGSLGEEYPPTGDRPSLLKYLNKEVHLAYKPGTKFQYSNPGFNLLELLVEDVTGRDFNEYMKNEVLLPLGMNNSSFDWNEEWSNRIPVGYDLKGSPVTSYVYPYRASGGLFSTVEDIARFTIAGAVSFNNEAPRVLSRESIQQIQSPQVDASGIFGFVADSYGFGHFIETLPSGKKAVWHGGQGHGWMSHFHLIPETGDGVVIFANSQRSWPFMASVLRDWSQWTGFGPVKFSLISRLVTALWIFTVLILLVSLWLFGQIAFGISKGRRKIKVSAAPVSAGRIVEFTMSILILLALLWAVTRDYLFISSIFPTGSGWLGWTLLLFSLALLALALLPAASREEG